MKFTTPIFLLFLSIIVSCSRDCEKVDSTYENGMKKIVLTYSDCSDTTSYSRASYYSNGQIASVGEIKDGLKNGDFQSWNNAGVQTADWHMLNDVEHGNVECWHDNGVKSKEVTIEHGVENGLQKMWSENGSLLSIGKFNYGNKVGVWKFSDENGGWKIRTYINNELNGYTNEHNVDSSGITVIVIGQYKDGLEFGTWKWFDVDSVLTQTAIYINGEATGEIVEYYKTGEIKLEGDLINGRYEGLVTYFHESGELNRVENYKNGELIKN
jgi:antitoxin component YwqK of YwqJK toxin-antitoxin module